MDGNIEKKSLLFDLAFELHLMKFGGSKTCFVIKDNFRGGSKHY